VSPGRAGFLVGIVAGALVLAGCSSSSGTGSTTTSPPPSASSSATVAFSAQALPTLDTPIGGGDTIGTAWRYDTALPVTAPTPPPSQSRYIFFCGIVPGTDGAATAAVTTTMFNATAPGTTLVLSAINYGTADAAQAAVVTLESALSTCQTQPDGQPLVFHPASSVAAGDGARVYLHDATPGTLTYALGVGRTDARVSVVQYASEAPSMTAATAQSFAATVAAAVAQLSSS
jgi:hypothetical protein